MVAEPKTQAQKTHVQMKDPTNAKEVDYAQSARIEGGRLIAMMYGLIDGDQYAWTRLENAKKGDEIWIDMTTDGGKTWNNYGRMTISNPAKRNYTDALKTHPSTQVRMRAWTEVPPGGQEHRHNTAPW